MTEDAGAARAGTVVLVGWTNVGKSTLLNRLVGERIAAVADVAQTTRHRILGVRKLVGGPLAFVESPGLHRPRHAMNRSMLETVERALEGVEAILLVVDASREFGAGDHEAALLLRRGGALRAVALNKVDLVRPKSRLLPMMQTASEAWGAQEVHAISAESGDGCDALASALLARMPVGPPLYPDDFLTDQTERTLVAERVREKLVAHTEQELPHATAVAVERWHERADGLVEVDVTILVDRESQKPIVIGRGGLVLKEVGTQARAELEAFFDRRFVLRLWVRVRPDWRDDESTLRELGL